MLILLAAFGVWDLLRVSHHSLDTAEPEVQLQVEDRECPQLERMAQRNLAEEARGLEFTSAPDGRITFADISE